MQRPEKKPNTAQFNLHERFVLHGQDGQVFSAHQLQQKAEIAASKLVDCCKLTLDCSSAQAVLIGLLLAQNHDLDVTLARTGTVQALLPKDRIELTPGVFAWLHPNASDATIGIRLQTSGTTGKAKTALYTLDRLISKVQSRPRNSHAVWLLTYEPASFAGIQVLLTAALTGSSVHAPDRSMPALAGAVRNGVTHISATPSFWRALLAAIPTSILLPLKVITLGGEPSSQALLDSLSNRFPGAAIRHIYASTEAGVGFTVADGLAGFPSKWLQSGIDGIELRIQNDELELKSAHGMIAYEGQQGHGDRPEWLRTGDLVEELNGRIYFQGRRDSMVNIGGTKVLPEKVEAALCEVDGLTDIAITAHPSPILGHILVAQVCAAAGVDPQQLEAALKVRAQQNLPPMAQPARYRFVESVVLATGKKARKHDPQ